MIKFIWDMVKQLPLPLLLVVSVVLGMFLLWAAAHVANMKYMVIGSLFAIITLFVISICQSAKR